MSINVCEIKLAQSCPTLCDLMDCSSPGPSGPSVHGILQARILEWVSIHSPLQRDLPNPGIKLGSPDSLLSELSGKPIMYSEIYL